jgi:hypothetical protein
MRSNAILAWSTLGALILIAGACSSTVDSNEPPAQPAKKVTPVAPPAFSDTTGEAAVPQAAYPAGPYGVVIGSVIEDFQFVGFQDAHKTTASMQSVNLSDFYNPHARVASYTPPAGGQDDRYFPTTAGYEAAGQLKPTVLLVQIASVWCGPCNNEAATILPPKHTTYLPCGGEFLVQLADSETPGTPATPKNLEEWTIKYLISYPSAIDPSYKLDPLYAADVFPQNFMIDTTTMQIVDILPGEAIPGTCNNAAGDQVTECAVDTDCQSCSQGMCGDGTTCSTAADCAAKTCTTFPFWAHYESLLDKTRSGCTVQ